MEGAVFLSHNNNDGRDDRDEWKTLVEDMYICLKLMTVMS